jgi:hypothetical protein
MIRPDGFRAAVFGLAEHGDPRRDAAARSMISRRLGVPDAWATVAQVHGTTTAIAEAPGFLGEADALFTGVPSLPLAVGTADCLPIVIEGAWSVAVVHAGWRGLASGVIESAVATMHGAGDRPLRAAIGPGIGPCCYEVGDDVAAQFAGFTAETAWGTPSVDLRAAAAARLPSLPVWVSPRCTGTDPELHSHRRTGTRERQVTVAWVPGV